MRTDVWEIHANGDTLIFGRASALYKVPKDIRQYRLALQVLHRMMRNHESARQIRAAYLDWSSRHLAKDLSEAEILHLVEDDIERHRVSVVALPHVYLHALSSKSAAAKGGTRRALIASTMAGRGGQPGHMASATKAPPEKPISQWELTEKFTWVFKRTADSRVGPEIARTLMEMTQPEKLAEMLVIAEVLAQVTLVANATPVGWIWDLSLAGIAYYFGGLAALETLSDLMIFLIRTIRAQTRADLEIASSALARAAIAFTIAGLSVLLHKIAARKGTGSGGGGGGEEPVTATKGAGGGKTGEPPSSRRVAAPKEEAAAAPKKSPPPKETESATPPKPPAESPQPAAQPPAEPGTPSNAAAKSAAADGLPSGMKATDNQSIREWYNKQTDPERLAKLDQQWQEQGLSAEQRAEKAFELRHEARLTARKFMENPEEVAALQQRDLAKYGNPDGPSFASEVAKYEQQGLKGDDAYNAIIKGASRTDSATNAKFGIKR